ncbi:MAG: ribonuclease H-like domain-containing protein [Planctomycetaceae bacterium]
MPEGKQKVSYLLFDVEAIGDGDLISRVRYPDQKLSPAAALAKYRKELIAEKGKDVLPTTFVLPIAVAIAKVAADFRLVDLIVLDPPEFRPHEIAKRFWQGWIHYGRPAFVTYNGRGYDLPVMELAAYRYGLSVPAWFNVDARSYEQSRNRYNTEAHIDLMDLFSNFGASHVSGGLNLLANLIGKPGKTGIDGSKIQDMYDAGKATEINDYCRCDVLDTYFVFLRSRVLLGKLSLADEQEIMDETKAWLEGEAKNCTAYRHYLEHWGDWQPPE